MSVYGSVGKNVSILLSKYGVNTVFGIPGVHNVELFSGIEEAGIGVILPRHEQGAAFMADGYARATGKPGVCYAITGPGVTNSLTPLGEAWSDSVPVMMIASSLARIHDRKDNGHLHAMRDQEGAARTVTALTMTADCEADIEEFCARSFTLFQTARPRPTYLQIPIDVMDRPAERGLKHRDIPAPPIALPEVMDKAAVILKTSTRTVIVAGGGAIKAGDLIEELAYRLDAAVVTTIAGKGILPEDNPRTLGAALQQKTTHAFLREAEVILVVGSELGPREYWCDPLPFEGTVIRIDIDAGTLAGSDVSHLSILSDARPAIDSLLTLLPSQSRTTGISLHDIKKIKSASQTEMKREQPTCVPLLEAMRSALPEDTIVSADMTWPAYSGSQIFDVIKPRSWLHPNGFGTLGYALPAAIGAKIGTPDRPVAVLVGDYGFQFTLPELSVAVERKLSMPIIVWNNESLFAIRDEMIRRQISPIAVHCQNPDFCLLGEAMGAASARPTSYAELEAEIIEALDRNRPTVIEARADLLKS